VRKALIGSFLFHVALTIGLFQWVSFRTVKYPPRYVYEVKLLGAAQSANAQPSANAETAEPKPAPLNEEKVEDRPDQMPAPPAEKKKPEEKKRDVAARTEVRRTDAKPDTHMVDSRTSRARVVSGTKDSRFAIDAPPGNNPAGEPGSGAVDIEARGSSVSQPLHMTYPGSYSETYIILRATQPKYPEHERERGIEGTVTVELLVDTEGNVAHANVLELVGPMSFQNSALDAVRQFEFQPPVENGEPTTMWIKFVIKFRINS
jgi:protein TonB